MQELFIPIPNWLIPVLSTGGEAGVKARSASFSDMPAALSSTKILASLPDCEKVISIFNLKLLPCNALSFPY